MDFANFEVQIYRTTITEKKFFFQILIFDPKRIFYVFCSIKFGKLPLMKMGVCCREHMLNSEKINKCQKYFGQNVFKISLMITFMFYISQGSELQGVRYR